MNICRVTVGCLWINSEKNSSLDFWFLCFMNLNKTWKMPNLLILCFKIMLCFRAGPYIFRRQAKTSDILKAVNTLCIWLVLLCCILWSVKLLAASSRVSEIVAYNYLVYFSCILCLSTGMDQLTLKSRRLNMLLYIYSSKIFPLGQETWIAIDPSDWVIQILTFIN